ncbi:MAG: bifunctional phosphopantothenoylcysteine decarboxylase/phosphopantothenate--cysteine ligase CoaBC [Gammaproteobacteria bacterium]|nr:bifunctional phosphopantothenoylcysteine decarboxylase/phosphopantothenate--cysteine ligase CoaBC [Gammaproteobacteria bacterium]MDH3506743.1 bifunctional phosphopantothenoylcysteine decarboxylase/phosphopantothenate--cysteine ligase CoaBC [Gammaproteobacteria bacterium]
MNAHDHKGPKILLGVTGGVAAYKSPELVRRLIEQGAQVQVVMTRGAREFVSPLTFQAVSSRRVRDDIWDSEAEAAMGHIELARWADLVLIAPATAHCLGSLANGLADDLLSTICLATTAPIMLAPAMNHVMWRHPAVQANKQLLEQRGARFLGPATGSQACGEEGPGRMLEPEQIVAAVFEEPARLASQSLKGLTVVITAGPTREPIDPVRYVTNRSSGKMGYALAHAAQQAGARVVLVSGPVALTPPPGVERVAVETAEEMYASVHEQIGTADLFIGCAAVSDYRPQSRAAQKIKRNAEEMSLALVRSPDTLASVAALDDGPFTVGFAAETQDVIGHARGKLTGKGVDMMAANLVGPRCGFDQETNELTVLWNGGEVQLDQAPKAMLAQRLIALIAERFHAVRGSDSAAPQTGTPVS